MASKPLSSIVIPQITEGDDFWRIDWFGDLSYPDRVRRNSQPSVQVVLSRVKGDYRFVDLNHKFSTDYENQRHVPLAVGWLPALKVGDIWRRGRYVATPAYATETFQDVQISPDNCEPITAGGHHVINEAGDKRFFIFKGYHPYHLGHTKSHCILIKEATSISGQAAKIVVPVMELVRFYFGSSSALISKLFSYGMVLDEIYDARKSEHLRSDGTSFIQLRLKMKNRSAHTIARIAFDRTAESAALKIGQSISRCAKDKKPIYPKSQFPFLGLTTLKMSGKWIPSTESEQIFVCYRLISCSAPFPFKELIFYRDNAGDSDGTFDPNRPEAFPDVPVTGQPNGDIDTVVDEYPAAALEDVDLTTQNEPPFPDLRQKPIRKQEKLPSTTRAADDPPTVEPGNGETLSVGEGGSDPTITPAEIQSEGEPEVSDEDCETYTEISPSLETFFRVIEALRRKPAILNISFEVPYRGGPDQRCSVFPIVGTPTGHIAKWVFIDYIKGRQHTTNIRRRIAIAKLTLEDRVRYVMDIERRAEGNGHSMDAYAMLLIAHQSGRPIPNHDLKGVLQECALNRGTWLTDDSFPYLWRQTIKHTFSKKVVTEEAIQAFAEKMFQKL